MLDTTPYTDKLSASLNEAIKSFTGGDCVMVRYLKDKDGKKGKSGNCHLNVKHFIEKKGGSSVSGWILKRDTSIIDKGMYVWSFHSVWLNPNNKLVDVTEDRHYVGRDKSIFIPDTYRVPDLVQGLSYNNFLIFTENNFAEYFGQSIGKSVTSNTLYWCNSTMTILIDIDKHSGIYHLVNSDYPKNIEKMCSEAECDFVNGRLIPRKGSKYEVSEALPNSFLFDYSMITRA